MGKKHNKKTTSKTVAKETLTPEMQPSTEKTVEEQIEETAYPDINKANTKTVVIWSLIVVLIVLVLSILIPPSTSTQNATSNTQTGVSDDTSESSTTESEQSTSEPTLFDIGLIETSASMEVFSLPRLPRATSGFQKINENIYYFQEGETPFSGWLNIDNVCYYIQENGMIATGWQELDDKTYYFSEDGKMQTRQWIDDKYVGTDGTMYTNAITPDGIYVDNDGLEDTSLGKTNSIAGLNDLKKTLEDMISGYSGTWSIYVKDIANKEYLSINNTQIFSASLIKLYCGAAAYDLIENGTMTETDHINSLMRQMISISDNDAFNLMVAKCSGTNNQVAGRPIIQSYIDSEGYKETTITSMLVPTKYKSPSSPGRNYTSVEDCGLLLEKIYKGKCVNPETSAKFLSLLLNQSHINKIPSGLPEGTKCANKTGDTNDYQHDAAIVYSPGGDYIITIMSTNCGAAIPNIRDISETVYNYFN